MNLQEQIVTDVERAKFLERLVESARGMSGVRLRLWELEFTGSFKKAQRPGFWFTEKRRIWTDRLWVEYGGVIGMPHPADLIKYGTSAPLPEAEAGGCMFFRRDDDRRQVRCNAPATLQSAKGFLYCGDCGEEAVKNSKRAGQTLTLIKYP